MREKLLKLMAENPELEVKVLVQQGGILPLDCYEDSYYDVTVETLYLYSITMDDEKWVTLDDLYSLIKEDIYTTEDDLYEDEINEKVQDIINNKDRKDFIVIFANNEK